MVFKHNNSNNNLLPFGPPPGRADFKIWGHTTSRSIITLPIKNGEEEAAPPIGRMTVEPSWGWVFF